MRIFIIGAIVLIVFALIGAANSVVDGTALGVPYQVWVIASLLSFFTDLLTGWAWAVGPFVRRDPPA